jgi:transposase InsO family protein
MLVSFLACLHLLANLCRWAPRLASCLGLRRNRLGYGRFVPNTASPRFRSSAKAAWVRHEVIRLKALMPQAGCRALADIFNRRFAAKRRTTVGKTFVSELIRKHRYEIDIVRRRIKNARPKPVPRNLVWALDLTGKATLDGSTRMVLGILEHASRAALWLEGLETKSSWVLIVKLIEAIRRYGKPRAVRTDNEPIFTSRAFRFALLLLDIRHQRTDPGCPWQNGRIERLFGTLKDKLDQLAVDSLETLNAALAEFRFFYNHVRQHQNLGGLTPAEVWTGATPFERGPKREYWFEAWDGLLTGYYLRR